MKLATWKYFNCSEAAIKTNCLQHFKRTIQYYRSSIVTNTWKKANVFSILCENTLHFSSVFLLYMRFYVFKHIIYRFVPIAITEWWNEMEEKPKIAPKKQLSLSKPRYSRSVWCAIIKHLYYVQFYSYQRWNWHNR